MLDNIKQKLKRTLDGARNALKRTIIRTRRRSAAFRRAGGMRRVMDNLVDGAFELILLRMPKTPLDLQNLIVAMTRQQYDYPGVIFRHVSNVTVTTEEDIPWSLDGEFAPSAPRVEIRNLPQAIQLML